MSALIGAVALLAGTVVGWALSHVSSVLARRVENRLQFNAVLAELLEIRHLLLVGSKTTDLLGTATRLLEPEQVQALGPVPPEVSAFMDQVIAQLVPGTAALEARYGDAVSAVARLDPALGHRLRDQDMLLRIALALTAMAKAAQAPADKVAASEDVIVQSLMPHLEELILDVAAKAGGWTERRRIRRLLKSTPRSEAEVRQWLQQVVDPLLRLFS